MTIDDIITCVEIVAYYNPSMSSLYDAFVAEKPKMADSQAAVDAAYTEGQPVYDTLIRVQVDLANAVHDFTYNIIHPFDSVQTKNVNREQICSELFGKSATF